MATVSQFPFPLSFSTEPEPITKSTFSLISKRATLSFQSTNVEKTPSGSLTSPSLYEKSDAKENKEKSNKENLSANLSSNEAAVTIAVELEEPKRLKDERWVKGTWDLHQFVKNGRTDWDDVIDAEARRRKWLEEYPETTNSQDAIYFDTSIIPWYAWIKRYHLPEAEKLNGRAAMIGFFMAYFVDSLNGVGLLDQTSNFFCKTLLFISVVGVLLVRNNDDLETLKKVLEETTFYDKQWRETWKDDSSMELKK